MLVNSTDDTVSRLQTNSNKASGDGGVTKNSTKNKNKIPKSLRVDLENALIGLCDVWFEEIKPYLVRNNIKLHVHDDTEGGDSGDREQMTYSANCSHLDPGRSDRVRRKTVLYADCCSTRPTASRVRCRKPLAVLQQLQCPPMGAETAPAQSQNHKKEISRKPRKRRKCGQMQLRQPVPRLCRTYSIPTSIDITEPFEKISLRNKNKIQLQRKIQIKNATTQTDIFNADKLFKKSFNMKSARLHNKQNAYDEVSLFQNDLIDLITQKHENKLKVLYTSPRNEYPSTINIFSHPKLYGKSNKSNKILPWR